jgi:hypothetical protein
VLDQPLEPNESGCIALTLAGIDWQEKSLGANHRDRKRVAEATTKPPPTRREPITTSPINEPIHHQPDQGAKPPPTLTH